MTTAYANPVSLIDHDSMPQSLPVITSLTINEGDLVCWDAANFSLRPAVEPKDAETGKTAHNSEGLIGVALGSNKPEVYGGDEAQNCLAVLVKGVAFLQATNAEKYKPFQKVTVGADAQTVSTSGVTANNLVGYVLVDPPATARAEEATPVPEEITGSTGLRIRVLLAPKYAPAAVI